MLSLESNTRNLKWMVWRIQNCPSTSHTVHMFQGLWIRVFSLYRWLTLWGSLLQCLQIAFLKCKMGLRVRGNQQNFQSNLYSVPQLHVTGLPSWISYTLGEQSISRTNGAPAHKCFMMERVGKCYNSMAAFLSDPGRGKHNLVIAVKPCNDGPWSP